MEIASPILKITLVSGAACFAYERVSPVAGKEIVTVLCSEDKTVPNPMRDSASLIHRWPGIKSINFKSSHYLQKKGIVDIKVRGILHKAVSERKIILTKD